MGERITILVSLVVFGAVLAKLFGTNEMGIPFVPLYGFMAGMGLGFCGLILLPFRAATSLSTFALVGAWSLCWLSEATLIAALLF